MSVSLSNPSAGTIVDIARGLAANHIHGPGTYERMGLSDPAVRVLKAAVGAGSLANPAWAGDLADLHRASTEFLGKLDGQSVFAAFLDLGIIGRAPFHVSLTGASMVAVASVAGEGQPRPVSKMQLFSDRLLPMQVDCIIVLTLELMDQTSSAGQAWVYRQLRRSVAVALDAGAIPALLLGATPVATTGDKAKDLAALLGVVNKTGQGRLAWIASANIGNMLATTDQTGSISPVGISEMLGLPLGISLGMDAGSLALIDADQTAGNISDLGLEVSRNAALNMDSAPSAPNSVTPTGSDMTSLWETNSVGIKVSALFAAASLPGSAAVMHDIDWTQP